MTDILRIGIIGCGGIAHQKHFPALSRNNRVEIVAFCDIIPERAEEAAKKFGVTGAKTYTDYKELLEDKAIDAVHVLTPNVSHCEISVNALEAGKHVLCEKPMAATAADAEKMMDAYKKSGKLLTIGYQNRFRDDSLTLKKYCETDALGEIYYAKGHAIRRRGVPTWGVFPNKALQGGGPLIDIGTHALDLTLWFMDNYEPASVMGKSFEKLGRTLNADEQGNMMGVWDPATYEVEDSAMGFITMKNGAVITLEASWAINMLDVKEAKTTLCGTKGGADMDDSLRFNNVVAGKTTVIKPDITSPEMMKMMIDYFPSMAARPEDIECSTWVNAILDGKELIVKPEQAFVVTKILDAIYQSSATGKAVYFD